MKRIWKKIQLQAECIDMQIGNSGTKQFRWVGEPYPPGAVHTMEGWLAELGGTYTVQIDGEILTVTRDS